MKRVRGSNRRLGIAVAAGAIIAVAASGCSAGTVVLPDATPTPTPSYTSTFVAPEPTAIAPLTGEVIEAGALANPSLAAKIDNHVAARPQVGLQHTDIVFEELVEGGLTRYVAIWQSTIPKLIGPVRSIRPMDPLIISPFRGIVAYSGGQQRFVSQMLDTPVYNAIHGQANTADTFFRTDTKEAPHNVLVRAKQLVAQKSALPAPAQQFAFALDAASSTAAKDGKKIKQIKLRFGSSSSPAWVYKNGFWLRSQAGAVDKDNEGKQLKATNVVVLRVPVSNDQNVPKTELVGEGVAWVASAGKVVHGHWSKSSKTARIRIVDDSGVTIRLAPGNSWIELVPVAGSADFIAG